MGINFRDDDTHGGVVIDFETVVRTRGLTRSPLMLGTGAVQTIIDKDTELRMARLEIAALESKLADYLAENYDLRERVRDMEWQLKEVSNGLPRKTD